jgi:DNA repair exonuclease SbcCD ATPase subunit
MKKTLTKVIGSSIITSILISPSISVKAETIGSPTNRDPRLEQIREMEKNRTKALRENHVNTTLNREARPENHGEIMKVRIERPFLHASTTEKRLENRENNIERIRARIASTTASSTKRLEKLDDRLEKQREQMTKVKERLLNKEVKATDILGKIASRIQVRITVLEGKGLNLTTAKTKLAEATAKIEQLSVEADNLATLVNTEITETNKESLFASIRASQDKIRVLAREAKTLLNSTIKEITLVLPRNGKASTTATTTI